jgi:hypothetical protein
LSTKKGPIRVYDSNFLVLVIAGLALEFPCHETPIGFGKQAVVPGNLAVPEHPE